MMQVHKFLNRIKRNRSLLMTSTRHKVWWKIVALSTHYFLDRTPAPASSDDNIGLIVGIIVGVIVLVIIVIVVLYYYKTRKSKLFQLTYYEA